MASSSSNGAVFSMPASETRFAKRVRSEMSDPKRLEAFAELKRSLADVWTEDFSDDIYLYRFLRARDFDASKSEVMVRSHLRWRREFKADELLSKTYRVPEVVQRFYPGGQCGVDKEGNPVWCEPYGFLDPQGLARSIPMDQLVRARVHVCERFVREILPKMRRETGLPLYSCTFVVDLQHYGRRHMWGPAMEFYREFSRICELNYPETMGISYIVNAPAIFPIVFNLLKPLMHPETQEKIKVLGRNYQQVLLEAIDADQLPQVFGGTRTDPDGDPRCRTVICWGGEVPEEMYLKPNYPDRLVSQSIGRRSKFRVEVEVPSGRDEDLCLEWDFLTEDGDLGFEIVRADAEKCDESAHSPLPPPPLLSYRRVHCGICPCSGAVRCPVPGTYAAIFDNSFSWVHAKRLRYFLHVTDKPLAGLMIDSRGPGASEDTDELEKKLDELMMTETAAAAAFDG